jgi:hypothetical protein
MDISNREINIGSCLGVNIPCRLEHIDLCDTTFAFGLRHDTSLRLEQYRTGIVPASILTEIRDKGSIN